MVVRPSPSSIRRPRLPKRLCCVCNVKVASICLSMQLSDANISKLVVTRKEKGPRFFKLTLSCYFYCCVISLRWRSNRCADGLQTNQLELGTFFYRTQSKCAY